MLVSSVLDFKTLMFHPGNDIPYFVFLPTFTATAWYHRALPKEFQKKPLADLVAEAERFAAGRYATALLKGTSIPAKEQRAIAHEFARLTGLSPEYVQEANLRVRMSRFAKELLRDRGPSSRPDLGRQAERARQT